MTYIRRVLVPLSPSHREDAAISCSRWRRERERERRERENFRCIFMRRCASRFSSNVYVRFYPYFPREFHEVARLRCSPTISGSRDEIFSDDSFPLSLSLSLFLPQVSGISFVDTNTIVENQADRSADRAPNSPRTDLTAAKRDCALAFFGSIAATVCFLDHRST